MSDYKITIARHTGKLKDDVTEHEVNRNEFKRVTGNEFIQIGMDVYQRYDITEHTATYLSIHPLRLSLS